MPPRTDRARKRLLLTAGLGALLPALALSSSPALAATTYSCTHTARSLTVPSGAFSATITLQGAAGRANDFGVSGGHGDSVNISMPVSPGQDLGLQVGCQDGFGGGGAGGWEAGNGGGASTISLDGTLYAVAGGGGGAGGQIGTPQEDSVFGTAGAGGDADSIAGGGNGIAGGSDPAAYAGQGGAGGAAGGAGGQAAQNPSNPGATAGTNGTFLQGGNGGAAAPGASGLSGGGGGGGYSGGGGGGGAAMWSGYNGGGGAGGGSSYVNTIGGATETSASATVTGDGSATITYEYAGAVMVSPNPVEFGKVVSVPGQSSTQTVTLTDVGSGNDGPVTLGAVHIGAAGSSFGIVSDNCSGQTLTGGQSCTMQVDYTPASGSEADESSTLVFPSNSVSGTLSAQMHGTAILPADMAVMPGSLDYGAVPTSSTATQTVAVFNTGDQRLDISAPSITGADADEFSLVAQQNLCPARLAAGGSCTLQVRFAPSRVSAAQATLRLTSGNAYLHPTVDVPLSGTGTIPAPLPTGPQGPQGDTGDTGDTGTGGTDGADGDNGTNGTNGVDGTNGTNGTNGTDGTNGVDGTNGTNGTNGAKGDTGATGPAGTRKRAKTARLRGVALRSRTHSPCLGCRSTGLRLTYTLARASDVHLTLQRQTARGWRPVGAETVAASAGRHALALENAFAHQLRRGTYRLVVQAQNGKSRSKAVTLTFLTAISRAGAVSIR